MTDEGFDGKDMPCWSKQNSSDFPITAHTSQNASRDVAGKAILSEGYEVETMVT